MYRSTFQNTFCVAPVPLLSCCIEIVIRRDTCASGGGTSAGSSGRSAGTTQNGASSGSGTVSFRSAGIGAYARPVGSRAAGSCGAVSTGGSASSTASYCRSHAPRSRVGRQRVSMFAQNAVLLSARSSAAGFVRRRKE